MTKTIRSTLRLFRCYYLVPAFTPSISGKNRGDREKWLWFLDSASVNYPRSDIRISVIFLAETCVIQVSANHNAIRFWIIDKCWIQISQTFFPVTSSFPGNWRSKSWKRLFWYFGQANTLPNWNTLKPLHFFLKYFSLRLHKKDFSLIMIFYKSSSVFSIHLSFTLCIYFSFQTISHLHIKCWPFLLLFKLFNSSFNYFKGSSTIYVTAKNYFFNPS